MTDGILVIIASGEEAPEKAFTGMMYAVNAKKNKWFENVSMMLFGPSEEFIAKADSESKPAQLLKSAVDIGITPIACKGISDRDDLTFDLKNLGVEVEYVGSIISSFIKKGYQVLTF